MRGRDPRSVLFIETSDQSILSHLDGLAAKLVEDGFAVTLVSGDQGRLVDCAARNGATAVALDMQRDPSLLRDVVSLLRLLHMLWVRRPAMVVYGTPKAALLGAAASWLVGVPRRVHVLHGLRVETLTGLKRRFFILSDRLIEALSTDNVAVGTQLALKAVELGDFRRMPVVLGHGSAQGVDTSRFRPARERDRTGRRFRVGFVGRLTADKGIDVMVEAFDRLVAAGADAELVLAGPPEGLHTLRPTTVRHIELNPRVVSVGSVADVPTLMQGLDVLCLATRREGLPTVLIEAGAAGVPIVATGATGVSDIVDHKRTGLIVPIDDACALSEALITVWQDPDAAERRAVALRIDVAHRFERSLVWERWSTFLAGRSLEADR